MFGTTVSSCEGMSCGDSCEPEPDQNGTCDENQECQKYNVSCPKSGIENDFSNNVKHL